MKQDNAKDSILIMPGNNENYGNYDSQVKIELRNIPTLSENENEDDIIEIQEIQSIDLNKNNSVNLSNKSQLKKPKDNNTYQEIKINTNQKDKENNISRSGDDLNKSDKEAVTEYNQLLFKLTKAGFSNIKVIQNCFRLYRRLSLDKIIGLCEFK